MQLYRLFPSWQFPPLRQVFTGAQSLMLFSHRVPLKPTVQLQWKPLGSSTQVPLLTHDSAWHFPVSHIKPLKPGPHTQVYDPYPSTQVLSPEQLLLKHWSEQRKYCNCSIFWVGHELQPKQLSVSSVSITFSIDLSQVCCEMLCSFHVLQYKDTVVVHSWFKLVPQTQGVCSTPVGNAFSKRDCMAMLRQTFNC